VADPLLSYNASDAGQRPQRSREFRLGDDPREDMVRPGDWVVGDEAFRRRLQRSGARPARRRGRPRKSPQEREGLFPEFYVETRDT
jgi:hypothetical protein